MPRFVPLILSMCFGLFASGQNIVYNGSFEDLASCTLTQGGLDSVIGWQQLYEVFEGSDAFSSCADSALFSVPQSTFHYLEPAHGENYGGFIGWSNYEGLLGSLQESLVKDTVYYVSYEISLWDDCLRAALGIGFHFFDSVYVLDIPFYSLYQASLLHDEYVTIKNAWQTLSWFYTATGNETHFAIGLLDTASYIDLNSGIYQSTYYFVDNVIVRKATQSEINGVSESQKRFSIYPNPATSIIRISTSGNEKPRSVFVFNPTGQVIRQEPFAQELDVSELTPGVYFLRLLFDDGSSAVRRFVRR